MSVAEVRALPVAVPITEAGRALLIGENRSYRLAREGRFPVPVLHLDGRMVVTRSALLALLGIEEEPVVRPIRAGVSRPDLGL